MPFNHYLSRKGCSASRKAALCVPAGLKARHLPIYFTPTGWISMDHGKSQQKTQKLQPQPQPADGHNKNVEDRRFWSLLRQPRGAAYGWTMD